MQGDYLSSQSHKNAVKSTAYYFIRLSFAMGVFMLVILLLAGAGVIGALAGGLFFWWFIHRVLWVSYNRFNPR